MHINHPTKFVIQPLKTQTAFGRFVVPEYVRSRTMYAKVLALPTEGTKAPLIVGDLVIYDTQGNFRELDEKTLVIPEEDLVCRVDREVVNE